MVEKNRMPLAQLFVELLKPKQGINTKIFKLLAQ
jgi:hypothetical protein